MTPPGYFNRVAASACKLWTQLDDPVLAGPWKQLFAQVQSPRHVLSELLQNADDAGAKAASVRVVDNEFVFEHDGEDFTEEQLRSLCRFGYSNKRNLHTIGFRGVGFKSTFSLGSSVRIQTPTLDVVFQRDQFTLPVWNTKATATTQTRISVPFSDKLRLAQLRKNCDEWATSPASLLFFRNLCQLTIGQFVVRKEVLGRGPVPRSQWVRLTGTTIDRVLIVESEVEEFPEDVVAEIRQERNVDDLNLPPCRVELVLGLTGQQRLFVVLPTGAEVSLPYSCNAPFIQDPARFSIKEPETSPCNRWLLERVGKLAAEVMTGWLEKEHFTMENRANAYSLLRGPVEPAADLTTACTETILNAFVATVSGKRILLTAGGGLVGTGASVALPEGLHTVWEPRQALMLFLPAASIPAARHLLAPEVTEDQQKMMAAHGWIEVIDTDSVLKTLAIHSAVPRPATLARLHALWNFAEENVHHDWNQVKRRGLKIVPVDGEATLQAADDVIRVSSRRDQISDADWDFISGFALAIDRDWLAYLAKLKPRTELEEVDPSVGLLQVLGLNEPSQVDRIALLASRRLLTRKEIPIADGVRITHILAALDAAVPEGFKFITQSACLLDASHGVVCDSDGTAESLVEPAWAGDHLLHPAYEQAFDSCRRDRWQAWVRSPKSRLFTFVPLLAKTEHLWGRSNVELFLARRGAANPKEYHYKRNEFVVLDHGLPPVLMNAWLIRSSTDSLLWSKILKGILLAPATHWHDKTEALVRQCGTQYSKNLDCGSIPAEWIIHFRSCRCLPDNHGNIRSPAELLLRTPETEPLMGLEAFVHPELDTPSNKRLLRLLGVQDTATGWDKTVGRLRTLAGLSESPLRFSADVIRLYEALDRITLRCLPRDMAELRSIFSQEPLILNSELEWGTAGEVSLLADADGDAPVVHSSVRHLALWHRIGVPDRPAVEQSLEWLRSLPTGARLDGPSYKRARTALARAGARVWNDCGHWMSLDATWEPVHALRYRVTMQHLVKWGELAPPTKQATADLRMLPVDVVGQSPFATPSNLADVVELRITRVVPLLDCQPARDWVAELANGFCRVNLPDEQSQIRVREVAARLAGTTWKPVSLVEVTPYIDGVPVGESYRPKVLWAERTLFVLNESTIRLYRDLKDELARPFSEHSVAEAIGHCIDRTAEFVREYLESNFELDQTMELALNAQTDQTLAQIATQAKATQASAVCEHHTEALQEDGLPPEIPAGVAELPESAADLVDPKLESPESPTPPKPKEPSFMDKFARLGGFRWHDGEKCYTHPDGRWLERAERPFNWVEYAADRTLLRRYWVSDQKLPEGVEIPAELWSLLAAHPTETGIVVAEANGTPGTFSGEELLELKDTQQVLLYPASYRLVEANL